MKQNRISIGLFFPNYDIQLKITTIIISENNINYHFVLMYFVLNIIIFLLNIHI